MKKLCFFLILLLSLPCFAVPYDNQGNLRYGYEEISPNIYSKSEFPHIYLKDNVRVWSDLSPLYIYDFSTKKWIFWNKELKNKYLYNAFYLCRDAQGEQPNYIVNQDFIIVAEFENFTHLYPDLDFNNLTLKQGKLYNKKYEIAVQNDKLIYKN